MKKNFRFLALSAAILSMFTACQREELDQNQKPETQTHTVTFVAGAPQTKTTVNIDGTTAEFSWTDADKDRFTVYENGTSANYTLGTLKDGVMTLEATFDGSAPESPSYQALYNTKVATSQSSYDSYDETADVLVSEVLDNTNRDATSYLFRFKRESAIAKMTLKGLKEGVCVSSVSIESDKPIAGEYDLESGAFISTSNSISIKTLSYIENDQATVWFAAIPVEEAKFTITATVVDNDENVIGTYSKTFSKTISFTPGDVKGFGVAMTKLVDPHKDDNGWFLVKDAKYLTAGDVIRIGCASAGKVAGALKGQILSSEFATYQNEQMVSVSNAENFTLGGEAGAWTLSTLTGKLGATAVKKLSEDQEVSGYVGTWTIDIDSEGVATIASAGDGYGRFLCNTSSGTERFTTYTSDTQSNMILPGIYKKYGTPAETKKNQTISFNPTSYTATIGKENTYPVLTAQSSGTKTWSSSNTEAATINESTGEITLVAAGKTTISVTVAGDDAYNEGTGSYELTVVDAPIVSTETWKLVTDASTLAAGDQLIIVCSSKKLAAGAISSSVMGNVAVTITNNEITSLPSDVVVLTLGGTSGSWTLANSEGKLLGATAVKKVAWGSGTTKWSISIDNNFATIQNGTSTYGRFLYNVDNPRFTTYTSKTASNMLLPELYRYE